MSDWAGIWTFAGVAPNATDRLAPAFERLGLNKLEQAHGSFACGASFAPPDFEDRVRTAQNQHGFAILAGRLRSPELNSAQHALELYVRDRTSFQVRLNGAFALLIYDRINSCLQLVRDPVGTMPIYYTTVDASVMFATRVAPLLERSSRREPDRAALAELFLGGRWFGLGETLYAGISVLPPGHMLALDRSGLRVERYWEFPLSERRFQKQRDYRTEFRRLFVQSVQRELGTRGTGVFVSGGLDSSAVYAAAQSLLSPAETVHGFTWCGDGDTTADESQYVSALEQHCGTVVERLPLTPTHEPHDDDLDILYGELPFPNNLPGTASRAHQAARTAGVDVVLDGGWADQVLSPYPPLYIASLIRQFRWLKATRHLRTYLRYFADTERSAILRQCGRAFVRLHAPAWLINKRRSQLKSKRDPGPFTDAMVRLLSPIERSAEWLPQGLSPHAQAVLSTVCNPAHVLRYECTTKLTGLYGVESRQPFLNCELVTFLATLPADVHSRGGVPKAILRDSLTGLVPKRILSRADKGDYTEAIRVGILHSWPRYAARVEASECAFDFGILEPRRLQARLALLERRRHIDTMAASWELMELYGLVVWLETFFGAGRNHVGRRHDGILETRT